MDLLGCIIAASLLASALVLFGVVGRLIDGACSEVRYSIAPAVVRGVRAWERERSPERGRPAAGPTTGPDGPSSPAGPDGRTAHRDGGLAVPMTRVRRGRTGVDALRSAVVRP